MTSRLPQTLLCPFLEDLADLGTYAEKLFIKQITGFFMSNQSQ